MKTFEEAVEIVVPAGKGIALPEAYERLDELKARYGALIEEVFLCKRLALLACAMFQLTIDGKIEADQMCISLIVTGMLIGIEMEKAE